MCGRYALALRPDQIRQRLQADGMAFSDAPADPVDDPDKDGPTPPSQDQPRQSYNFAPGYYGVVYRADVPDRGAGPHRSKKGDAESAPSSSQGNDGQDHGGDGEVRYKLQAMKWGLIPFWTKRNPDYSTMMKTINCRDDSLAGSGGMWSSMKARKRCIVIAEGFYEWLKTGPKERVPYYIKRKDGKLLCLAGLWDCVQYENDDQKHYTYTIITTDSNKQLNFLHDRMPVVLDPGSDALRTWLDPARHEWSAELQALLCPWDGELDVYAVSKDVNKAGNSSPSFVIPVASRENKSNIANFFANAGEKKKKKQSEVKVEDFTSADAEKQGLKRSAETSYPLDADEQPSPEKKRAVTIPPPSPAKTSKTISATKNSANRSPAKARDTKAAGMQKITKFFSK